MMFEPRMQNKINGFTVVGDWHRRRWNGMVVDVWDVTCAPSAGGYYVSADPRLFVVLEARGGHQSQIRLSPVSYGAMPGPADVSISYIPADMELWADMAGITSVRHLDLHFSIDVLSQRLKEDFDPRPLSHPRLMFSDARLLSLAHLIAAECANPQPLHDLYGDSLAIALLVGILKLSHSSGRKRSQLASWQLRRAIDHIEENCLRNIRLDELAALAGLSSSHFSHAFKASTGMAPHQWQMKARIDRAKQHLLKNRMPLTAIAAETGFADQAHFTRVFRKIMSTTPAQWKKAHLL